MKDKKLAMYRVNVTVRQQFAEIDPCCISDPPQFPERRSHWRQADHQFLRSSRCKWPQIRPLDPRYILYRAPNHSSHELAVFIHQILTPLPMCYAASRCPKNLDFRHG